MSRVGGGIWLVVIWVAVALAQDDMPEMAGFRVPEYDKDGNKKSELTGDLAHMLDNGLVDITNLKIEFFKNTQVQARVTAPQCTYNQEKGTAESDKSVRMARDNMVVTGVGFSWDKTNEVMKIFSEAKVVIRSLKKYTEAGEKK